MARSEFNVKLEPYGTVRENLMATDTAPEGQRSDARRRAILEVGREVFLAQGYAATSMSEIAAKLGGSKGTLYNYFRSKEELFSAFITDTCQGPAMALFDQLPTADAGKSIRDNLVEFGANFLGFILSPRLIALN